jgi:cobalt-zinc-cadmium efflux system protein
MSSKHSHTGSGGTGNAGKLKIALALTGTYLIAEVAGAFLTGSLALLSDAAHMLTDVMALIVALVAIRIGQRAADAKRTFGYYRFEILAAAFNAAVLFLVAFYILYEAYRRFQEPPEVQTGGMLIVAVIGLLVNVASMLILRSGSESSLNMKGAYLEVWSDALGSVAVIVAALIIRYTGWWPVDPILAVLIGLWVLPRTWQLLGQSINVLLEGVPKGFELQKLHAALAALPGVREVHDLHVWSLTSDRNSMTVHLVVDSPNTQLVAEAQRIAREHDIEHASIQLDDVAFAASERGVHPRLGT